jgi:hypothetical protein
MITDENGEPLIGAAVVFKDQPTVGVTADYNGKFSIKTSPGTKVMVVSYIGYKVIEEEITVASQQIIIKNFTLVPESKMFEDVVVTAKAKRADETYMQLIKSKSSVSIDFISAETVKKTGDSKVDDAVKRITGVTTVGGFITVRGLADRYVKTAINGSRIPTLDPITNNIKLDLFPTNLVDNIVITKTLSPELSGDWAGAYISIETRDYPDKLTLSFTTTFGYNSLSTFKNTVSSPHSKTEWLGFDSDFRDINHLENYPRYYSNPDTYLEFQAIDNLFNKSLEVDLAARGITPENYSENPLYVPLGLIDLGLLSPGSIYDEQAIAAAKVEYDQLYAAPAFDYIHKDLAEFGQSLPNNWSLIERKGTMDFSQDFVIGNQVNLFKKPLGYLLGFRYATSTRFDPNANGINKMVRGANENEPQIFSEFSEAVTTENYGWSALMNIAYKINQNNSLLFLFMPNFYGVNSVRSTRYTIQDFDDLQLAENQRYEERKQMIYQFQSTHYLPGPGLRIDLNASYTDGESNSPDFKNVRYSLDSLNNKRLSNVDYPERLYRYLDEDIFDTRLSFELPIAKVAGLSRKIRLGASGQFNTKKTDQYRYQIRQTALLNSHDEDYLSLDNFALNNGSLLMYYASIGGASNFTTGYSNITAAFAMIDYGFTERIRVSGGLRIEYTDMFGDILLYDQLGLPANDPIRETKETIGGQTFSFGALNPSVLQQYDYLPSLNIIFKLKNDDLAPVNLRLNYSRAIARPSLREINPYFNYDYALRAFVTGNPDLKITSIHNFDIRFESAFRNGDNISASLFYKSFLDHIEFIGSDNSYSWTNSDFSEAYGIEIEGRKSLSKNLDFRANVSLIRSYTLQDVNADTKKTTALFGQAPYVINAILEYNSSASGVSGALSYNVQGAKLVVVSKVPGLPDIYELPRHMVDFKLSKNLGKHFSASFKIRNILDAKNVRSYDFDDWAMDYSSYRSGTDYSLGITYSL